MKMDKKMDHIVSYQETGNMKREETIKTDKGMDE